MCAPIYILYVLLFIYTLLTDIRFSNVDSHALRSSVVKNPPPHVDIHLATSIPFMVATFKIGRGYRRRGAGVDTHVRF